VGLKVVRSNGGNLGRADQAPQVAAVRVDGPQFKLVIHGSRECQNLSIR
jgi:hypothetical protein